MPSPSPPERKPLLPPGACDCHVHVIGPAERYPMTADRHYTPGPAPLHALQAHMAALGLERAVIVQPSVYGTDNRCLLDSLDQLEARGRGVAVPPDDVSSRELREMHARGVRGVRINLESSGTRAVDAGAAQAQRWARRVADLGWHLQLYACASVVEALSCRLVRLPTPVVLDHFALAEGVPGATTTSLWVDLLRTGRVSVKLSAAYRLPVPDVARAWADVFLGAAPERVLWGSDWPHTAREPGQDALQVSPYRAIATNELAASRDAWLATPEQRRRVLVDNPRMLYGF
jgi:predicted TIM-barrel fold metal-dependent hydrolase